MTAIGRGQGAKNNPWLLDNPAVEWRAILAVHARRVMERMAGQSVIV